MGLFLVLSWSQATAQIDNFMWHRGFFFGQKALPAFNYFPDSLARVNYMQQDSVSLNGRNATQFGLNWGARVNVYNIDDDHSVSVQVDVLASIYLDPQTLATNFFTMSTGSGLQIPIVVNYNIGHMATKNSVSDRGYAIGLGLEINRMSYRSTTIENDISFFSFDPNILEINTGVWMQPVLNLGYRYWKGDTKAREANLQIGWGYLDRLSTGSSFRPNVRLSLHKYINY
jgi:hypothetical protein